MTDPDILEDIFDAENEDDDYLFGAEATSADAESDVDVPEEPELPTPVIDISVSDDKLAAYLSISQSPPQPYQITVDDIYNALAASRVENGVMLEKIDLIVNNQEYPVDELIAVGKNMVPGVDAELEYLFSTTAGGRPTDLGHYVDHFDLNLVENVSARPGVGPEDLPVPGEDGLSVYGQPLRALRAKDLRLPGGKGTQISETNPNELIAKVDGFVRLDTRSFNKVVVEEVFNVGKDVDLSTGNLDIEGSVNIRGSVREGFAVKATGNIKISGRVEAAVLEAGGSIEIAGGIIGGKKGATITATENITVRFADHATMTAGGNINVGDEAVNCTIHADKAVVAGGRSQHSGGAIIGGFVSAGYEIKAISIGSDAGILTRLRVGEQIGVNARKQNMQIDIKNHKDKIAELNRVVNSLVEREAEREPARQERTRQKKELEKHQSAYYEKMRSILNKAERDGLITSTSVIDSLEEQISETRGTLQRVESSIQTLKTRLENKASIADSLKNKKTLEQFRAARENLISKLNDLDNQLAQHSVNPWSKLPWATRRELEQIQEQLKSITTHITAIEAEDATDQQISEALRQMRSQYEDTKDELAALQEEMAELKLEGERASNKIPYVLASDKLWSGAEISIRNRKRRFTRDRTGVKIQLSENDAIIALNLAG